MLQTLAILGPGIRGLNTELPPGMGFVMRDWALGLDNVVFDDLGRITLRKGYVDQTSNPAMGSGGASAATCTILASNSAIGGGSSGGEMFNSNTWFSGTDWTEGTDNITVELTHYHPNNFSGVPPAFPGGSWDVIGNSPSFVTFDDGSEQPPDPPFVDNALMSSYSPLFEDDGGSRWYRGTLILNGPGGDSPPCEFFWKDLGF
mgnify:CR=1